MVWKKPPSPLITKNMSERPKGPPSLEEIKARANRPQKAVVTAGMPYSNGPIHIGHLAGAHVPPDVYARWLRMLIGAENVLFVCGSDDHGSTSELAAIKAGKSVKDFISGIRDQQKKTFDAYKIAFDTYTGTSHPECFPIHKEVTQTLIRKLHKNGMLEKKVSKQWFDEKLNRFLQDRFVNGKCPKCDNTKAFSDECDNCGAQYDPSELLNPVSTLSDATPVLKDTTHWWLDLWKVGDELKTWIESKKKNWRAGVFKQALDTVTPAFQFSNTYEARYKELKAELPSHKSRYAPGKKVVVLCESKADMKKAFDQLKLEGMDCEVLNAWALRSISRDVAWGIPMPEDLDPEMKDKTFYVWPESLIAPIAFTKVALKAKGRDPNESESFWCNPEAKIYQFIGQDNIYFYTLMQGALWLGSQSEIHRQPLAGELQLTDVYSNYHLTIDGDKMSKSKGNFYTADELINEKGYHPDQIRYFLSILSISEKNSNFDFKTFEERNKFLAGPLNAAFEKPISACHSKYNGKVPDGDLNPKVAQETTKLIQKYIKAMERIEYPQLLFAIENYARLVNSMFTQFKPHDDRAPEKERNDALYSCFYVLKNITIMLHPFVPETMDKLRVSLNLPESVYSFDELGTELKAGHPIGTQQSYFPAVD